MSTNFTATGTNFSTEASVDVPFDDDSYLLFKAAVEDHTHASTRGAAVARVASAVSGAPVFSGAVTSTGLLTASAGLTVTTGNLTMTAGRVSWAGNGTGAAGSIYKDAGGGLVIRGVTGSGQDFTVLNNAGSGAFNVPAGTTNVVVVGTLTSGAAAITGNSTVTGTLTVTSTLTVSAGGAIINGSVALIGALTLTSAGASLFTLNAAYTDHVGAQAGTLTNAPAIGNPAKWFGINDNGTVYKIPGWT